MDPEPLPAVAKGGLTPQRELSHRLRQLIDAMTAELGHPLLFSEISAAMTARGVTLTRARWAYLKDGNGRLIHDRRLMTALAGYFNIDPEYLLSVEITETLPSTDHEIDLARATRAERVKNFVATTIGDISQETLEVVIEYLDSDTQPELETVNDSEDSPAAHPKVP